MKCDFCERTDTDCRIRRVNGKNYCPKHITRHYRGQDMDALSIYDKNDIRINDDHAEIVLRDKYGVIVASALIDLDDVERCRQYKWYARKTRNTYYAMASVAPNKKVFLHRFIMGYFGGDDVDHINRNGLDNRKSNLRIVTHQENACNNGASGVKLVGSGRYQASCCRNYKTIYIGTFDSYDEAVTARAEFIKNL